jgi:hypothetical protein
MLGKMSGVDPKLVKKAYEVAQRVKKGKSMDTPMKKGKSCKK